MVSKRLRRFLLPLCLLLTPSLVVSSAFAKDLSEISEIDKETARRLLDEGDALFTKKDFEGALEKYKAADDIMGVPTTASEVGKTLEKLGRLVEARDAYLRIVRYPQQEDEPGVFKKARKTADAKAAALAERVGTLTVNVTLNGERESEVGLVIDGTAINAAAIGHGISVDPGTRKLKITAPGYLPVERDVTLDEGGEESVDVSLEVDPDAPVDPPPPDPGGGGAGDPGPTTQEAGFPVFATIGFAVGGAGLVLGGVTGGLALGEEGSLADACTDDKRCPLDTQADIDRANLLANLSNVGFAVGAAGAIFGVIALFTLDAPSETATDPPEEGVVLTPIIGPTGAWLRGTF